MNPRPTSNASFVALDAQVRVWKNEFLPWARGAAIRMIEHVDLEHVTQPLGVRKNSAVREKGVE